ncbi:cold shock domain-containing protein [Oligella ureolytica]
MSKENGVVKWFNNQKGFGFIKPSSGGQDLFVHHTDIESDGYRTLEENQEVTLLLLMVLKVHKLKKLTRYLSSI